MAAQSPPCRLLRALPTCCPHPFLSSSSLGQGIRRRAGSLLRCSSPSEDASSPSGEGRREYQPSFADDLFLAFFRAKMVEEVGWDSEKPGYSGLLEVANRLMVFVEKCKYLEESKCLGICINTCKLPTQTFFKDHMGVDLYMEPNFEDYSCQFNFGVPPPPLDTDKALKEPCLDICTNARRRKELGTSSGTDGLQCPQV
uniref:Beta-carotene isomerase D27-like C-terminal domain-containing protein n=1 Tax=Leersia perrieri TaxID=77586 RepID=A0A0D9WCD4_9ORYZ